MRGLKEDFRNGAIIAGFAICLFLVAMALRAPTARYDGNGFRPVVGRERVVVLPPAAARGADPPNAARVPILCHHYIRRDAQPLELVKILGALFLNLPVLGNMDVWTQTESAFAKQMAYLDRHGYTTIGMDDLAAWRSGRKTLPEKSVVITFDDGDRSVMDIAYPILKEYGMKATLFIVTDQVGTEWQGIRGLTWDELRSLQNSGVFSIESHTNDLHYTVKTAKGHLPVITAMSRGLYRDAPGTVWQDVILEDLVESRRLIADHLTHDSRHLAWPYGASNPAVDSLAALAGFRTLSSMRIQWSHDPRDAAVSPLPGGTFSAGFAPRDPVAGRFAAAGGRGIPGGLELRTNWRDTKIDRYAITARTSIRGFVQIFAP
jgi:peptidoglycan/xylan/chitin deacetylase (PgdA/CDA1 family)